jgi:hypothetical protein
MRLHEDGGEAGGRLGGACDVAVDGGGCDGDGVNLGGREYCCVKSK